jgi:hypothetical protein
MGSKITDILERALASFAQAFLSVIVVTDLSSAEGAATAGLAAVVSLLKSIVATRTGDGSPSIVS